MLSQLVALAKVAGVKQSKKAIKDGLVDKVFIAQDADVHVTKPIIELCVRDNIEVVEVPTMSELGNACGIDVGAAVVAVLK